MTCGATVPRWLVLLGLLAGCPGEAPIRKDRTAGEPGGLSFLDGSADHPALPLDGPSGSEEAARDVLAPPPPPPACTPGRTDSQPCGMCQSGKRTRTCTTAGTWGAWSGCLGEEKGFPYHPSTMQPVCPPYAPWPAVFFAPHPDDETIFMGGAIKSHRDAGRPVFVELMTHGEASGVFAILNGSTTCGWHTGNHGLSLSIQDFGNARVTEFLDATSRLAVNGVFVSNFGDGNVTAGEVASRIAFWLKWQDPVKGVSLKGTAVKPTFSYKHVDHQAVWNALVASGHGDIRGYAGAADGTPDMTAVLGASACAAKNNAWQAYMLWSPANGRYAIGRHSVGLTTMDCKEYVWLP